MNSRRRREVFHKRSINKREDEITGHAIAVMSDFLYNNLMRRLPLPSRFFTMISPYIAARWLEIEPHRHRGESHGQHQSSFGGASRACRIAPRRRRRFQVACRAERGGADRRHEPRAHRARRLPVLGDVPGRSRHRCGLTRALRLARRCHHGPNCFRRVRDRPKGTAAVRRDAERAGSWTACDRGGRIERIFPTQREAIHFALFETGTRCAAVSLTPGL
jgi:hypothetical protein